MNCNINDVAVTVQRARHRHRLHSPPRSSYHHRQSTVSMKGAVAAGHRATAAAAADILRAGGNAFDAAVGGLFAACVAEPALASLGGGGYLLARERTGRSSVFDFFTHTPGAQPRPGGIDFYPVTVDFGAARQVFHIGAGANDARQTAAARRHTPQLTVGRCVGGVGA